MTGIFTLLITWPLWAYNFGHCAEVTVQAEFNYDNASNSTEVPFSQHFRTVITGIYKQSFDNFNEVMHLSEISDDVNFKADVLLGLYDAMSKAHHTDVPFYAIDLYNKIEALLNVNSTSMYPAKSNELQRILDVLLLNTIVPKGSHILESAVYLKGSNQRGTPFEKLLKMLLTTNHTVANLTFGAMVARARWALPIAELTPILANFSPNKKQNVDLLLLLNDEGPFQKAEENIISRQLAQLEKKLDYTSECERKMRVNATVPLESPLLNLLNGEVCFYQELSTEKRRYIFKNCAGSDMRMCLFEYGQDVYTYRNKMFGAKFYTKLKQNSLDFNFRSSSYGKIGMSTLTGYNYVFNLELYTEWRAQVEGEQVVLQDKESTWYLCADNENERYVYIKDEDYFLSLKDECKWFVEDCRSVSDD